MKQTRIIAWLVLASVSGCVSFPDSDVLFESVVLTHYDPKANFASYTTFSVNPTVSFIDNQNTTETLDPALAAPLIDAAKKNFSDRGYQHVEADQSPDLGVDIVLIRTVNVQTFPPYFWWGWGWAGNPGWWGFSTSAYVMPPGWVVSSYATGTMEVQTFDLKQSRAEENASDIPLLWEATVYGVLGSQSANVQAGVNGINQAFTQSPYIAGPQP